MQKKKNEAFKPTQANTSEYVLSDSWNLSAGDTFRTSIFFFVHR